MAARYSARQGITEATLLGACLLLTLALAHVLALAPRATQLSLTQAATGLYPTEYFVDRGAEYHWTNGDARLAAANPGGSIILRLDLAGGPGRTTRAQVAADRTTIAFMVTPEVRRYQLLLKPQGNTKISVGLRSDTVQESSGERTLGVVISGGQIAGGGVPGQLQLVLLAAVAVIYGLARWLRLPQAWVVIAALGAGAGAAVSTAAGWSSPSPLAGGLIWPGLVALVLAAPGGWRTMRYVSTRIPLAGVVLAASCVVLGARYIAFIDRYAVDIPFSDEWDILNPLFRGQNVAAMFFYQHGPHRQGLGGLVVAATAWASGWNARANAAVVGAIMVLAMAVALLLKRRLTGRWSPGDMVIPLIYLTTAQYEALTVVPNPAHGALPALLALLVPLASLIRRPVFRYTALAALSVLTTFTGFGIFMGLLIPALVGIELVHALLRRDQPWLPPALALVPMVAGWLVFLSDYRFSSAVGCFVFPHPRPLEYPAFVALMFSRVMGFDAAASPATAGVIGGTLLLGSVWLALQGIIKIIRRGAMVDPITRTVAILTGFSLLFCINTAIGRVCTGVMAGQASRYVPLLTPAFFGVYLALFQVRRPAVRLAATALLIALLLPVGLPIRVDDAAEARGFAENKRRWRDCYLATHAISLCDSRINIPLYPSAAALQPKLDYLEEHGLSFFRDS